MEKLLLSSGKQFPRSSENMDGINMPVSKCNFVIPFNLCCPLVYHLDKSFNTWRKNDNSLKRLLLYKIFCVIKPHPMGLTQRSLYMLLDSGMLSVLDSVPVGQSYDANGDSEMKP